MRGTIATFEEFPLLIKVLLFFHLKGAFVPSEGHHCSQGRASLLPMKGITAANEGRRCCQ